VLPSLLETKFIGDAIKANGITQSSNMGLGRGRRAIRLHYQAHLGAVKRLSPGLENVEGQTCSNRRQEQLWQRPPHCQQERYAEKTGLRV